MLIPRNVKIAAVLPESASDVATPSMSDRIGVVESSRSGSNGGRSSGGGRLRENDC